MLPEPVVLPVAAASFRYPGSDLDNADKLLSLLGSFWQGTYGGSDLIRSMLAADAALARQQANNTAEAVDRSCRLTAPVYHTEQWYPLVLQESAMNNSSVAGPRYGNGTIHGTQADGSVRYYGVPAPTDGYGFLLPAALHGVSLIFNQTSNPSRTLTAGVDFTFDPDTHLIVFRTNPFEDDQIEKRSVLVDGVQTDREVTLWIFRGLFDREDVYYSHGYPLGIRRPSSENYRALVNALWTSLLRGGCREDVERVLSAVTGIPLAAGAETVELIFENGDELQVITDQEVYRYSAAAVPLVSMGDAVAAGQPLVDALEIHEFGRGELPDWLRALELNDNFLIAGFHAGLIFENRNVPLAVDTSGIFTKVSFALGGRNSDVAQFWNEVHQRGVAAGQTLAHLLDQRTTKVGEPQSENLPETINPLRFLAENVFRCHAFVARIRLAALGRDALPLTDLRVLRRIVPPHTSFILLLELTADTDEIDAEDVEEATIPFLAAEPVVDDVDGEAEIIESPKLNRVDGICP